jgi:hypothetical protein
MSIYKVEKDKQSESTSNFVHGAWQSMKCC